MAHSRSIQKEIETPFQKHCKKLFNLNWYGGKPDDITVIAAFVKRYK